MAEAIDIDFTVAICILGLGKAPGSTVLLRGIGGLSGCDVKRDVFDAYFATGYVLATCPPNRLSVTFGEAASAARLPRRVD